MSCQRNSTEKSKKHNFQFLEASAYRPDDQVRAARPVCGFDIFKNGNEWREREKKSDTDMDRSSTLPQTKTAQTLKNSCEQEILCFEKGS